jgi:hypothetical protein
MAEIVEPPPPPDPLTVTVGTATLTYSIIGGYITIDNPGDTMITINGDLTMTTGGINVDGVLNLVASSAVNIIAPNAGIQAATSITGETNISGATTINGNTDVIGGVSVNGNISTTSSSIDITSVSIDVNSDGFSLVTNVFNWISSTIEADIQTVTASLNSVITSVTNNLETSIGGSWITAVAGDVYQCFKRNVRRHVRGKSISTAPEVPLVVEDLYVMSSCMDSYENTGGTPFPDLPRVPDWPGINGQPRDLEEE